ncbi:hypothetical protein SPHFLASMR4Y_02915 [Sphingorhabdus sp. SMR4y]|nr:hypothetical protein SPHFLASMR4Y_02915 [Sphingorhabdus sp. SMR4y]
MRLGSNPSWRKAGGHVTASRFVSSQYLDQICARLDHCLKRAFVKQLPHPKSSMSITGTNLEIIVQHSRKPKKNKSSKYISRAAARNLHHATRFAKQVGGQQSARTYPNSNVNAEFELNMYVTINWDLTETGHDNFKELRNQRFCRWLRTRCKQLEICVPPTYVYSREQDPEHGHDHVHWQVHVPEQLIEEFTDLVPRWITSLENKGEPPRKRSQNHQPAPDGSVDIQVARNSVAIRKYLLKGIDPREAYRFGIRKMSSQGTVVGPRTGVSRSLGKGARDRAKYKPRPTVWMTGNGRSVLTYASVRRQNIWH